MYRIPSLEIFENMISFESINSANPETITKASKEIQCKAKKFIDKIATVNDNDK